jgi:hypothetical protein
MAAVLDDLHTRAADFAASAASALPAGRDRAATEAGR